METMETATQERELEIRSVQPVIEPAEGQVGNPASLGLFTFAVGATLAGFFVAGIGPSTGVFGALGPIGAAIFVFAGVAQFIAGIISYSRGNSFSGTVFCIYGAFYALLATAVASVHLATLGTGFLPAIGLLCFAYISLALAIEAARHAPSYAGFLWSLVPGFALPAIAMFTGSGELLRIGGYLLLLSALFAYYAASERTFAHAIGQRRFSGTWRTPHHSAS
jgi:succinate-acetate transporter protein